MSQGSPVIHLCKQHQVDFYSCDKIDCIICNLQKELEQAKATLSLEHKIGFATSAELEMTLDQLAIANKLIKDLKAIASIHWKQANLFKGKWRAAVKRIEEAEKQEPVAWYTDDQLESRNDVEVIWNSQMPKYAENWEPLYAVPLPSLNIAKLERQWKTAAQAVDDYSMRLTEAQQRIAELESLLKEQQAISDSRNDHIKKLEDKLSY